MANAILDKLGMIPFKPLPFISSGKAQTIAAYYFPYNPLINNKRQHVVTLADGDQIVLIENRPQQYRHSQRIVLLVHGLTGSHLSKHIVRTTHQLLNQGFVVFRMNLRGCGAGKGLAKLLYHSGRSEDTREVIHWLAKHYPNSPVTQIGFSLGGNITLKMAGEDANKPTANLDSIVAISSPIDLETSVKLIIKRQNALFNDYFVKGLLRDMQKLQPHHPIHSRPSPKVLNIYEFDDMFTAPQNGFKNAKDYYTQCSSGQFIQQITLPTFILYATDDPVISRRSYLRLPQKENFDVLITPKGGHVAWLGRTDTPYSCRWMDRIIIKWVNWFDNMKKQR